MKIEIIVVLIIITIVVISTVFAISAQSKKKCETLLWKIENYGGVATEEEVDNCVVYRIKFPAYEIRLSK